MHTAEGGMMLHGIVQRRFVTLCTTAHASHDSVLHDACCYAMLRVGFSVQTRYELVVVHEDEEKCRDAMYDKAAGASVSKAVHISGLNFSRIRNDCIMVGRPYKKRCVGPSLGGLMTVTPDALSATVAVAGGYVLHVDS